MRFLLPLIFVVCLAAAPPPDITVAANGSGDFTSIQKAVESIPKTNRQRIVIYIKPGVYVEKIRIDAPFVTLRGAGRHATRVEFPQLANDFNKNHDPLSRAVININSSDVVLQDMTIVNTAGIIGPHEVAVYGVGDRTVILDCDVLSEGADTVSLWRGKDGRYYHARCNFRGSVDFVCPRGWCYITDSHFYECMGDTASIWQDGHVNKDMKFVLHHCSFDGYEDFNLGRHKEDAAFYFLDCRFSKNLADRAPWRVVYPINGDRPTDKELKETRDLDFENQWGERAYYFDCHRDGGDYGWFKDNLKSAPGSPCPENVTAEWTFGAKWDPEKATGPKTKSIIVDGDQVNIKFNEAVTVKGKPRLVMSDGSRADYVSGSGNKTLIFKAVDSKSEGLPAVPVGILMDGAWVIASEAGANVRQAEFELVGGR
jgi:pectinesterase